VTRPSTAHRARLGISRSFQALEMFEDMTVRQNLQVASDRVRAGRYLSDLIWPRKTMLSEATRLAVAESRLEPILDKFPADIDYATRRLVSIARAMASWPTVILLDEPATDVLRTRQLNVGYSGAAVERDIDLRVAAGEVVADSAARRSPVRRDPGQVERQPGPAGHHPGAGTCLR
jgi:ABC-type branched-subunit amino acid transport system ATPase component